MFISSEDASPNFEEKTLVLVPNIYTYKVIICHNGISKRNNICTAGALCFSRSGSVYFAIGLRLYTSVSVGNVGQLSADLLISTLLMKRIGYIHHESILPMVGNDPFAGVDATTCKIVTSCEVYESMQKKLVVIQQRAPFIKTKLVLSGQNAVFVKEAINELSHDFSVFVWYPVFFKGKRPCFRNWLVQWIKDSKFKMVIILTSTHAHERIDVQLQGSQFRYVASSQIEEQFGDVFRNLHHWDVLERRTKFPAPSPIDQPMGEATELYLPGGGIAKSLFEDLCNAGVPAAVLLIFCAEGDNVQEAIILANQLNTWLQLIDFHKKTLDNTWTLTEQSLNNWKIPMSWKLFFGSKVDQTLFH